MSELEMMNLPWFNVEERIQRIREIGMLQGICHLRPTHPLWEGLEDSEKEVCEGSPSSLEEL